MPLGARKWVTAALVRGSVWLGAWAVEWFCEVMLFKMLLPFSFIAPLARNDELRAFLGIPCQAAHTLQGGFCDVGDILARGENGLIDDGNSRTACAARAATKQHGEDCIKA